LSGIKVIDLTTAVLGPLATQLLGDLGADVVKIESPAGDDMRNLGPARHRGMSALFLNLNRNKRSVVLDLKQPGDHAALLRLVAGADVLVHNMRPQAAARLKMSYADIAAGNPRLIYAAACGYSEASPDRDRPAFDDIMQGATGIAGAFLRSDGQPRYAPFLVADKVVGHVLASAIGFALFERAGSGMGQEVKVPMFETMVSFNLVEHLWGGVFDPPMHGLGYSRIFVPERRPFETKDGFICVTATTDPQWRRLFASVGHPELADDERFATMASRTFHFAEAYQYLRTALLARTSAEWKAIFDTADLPNGPANSLDDLLADRHLNQSGFFKTYDHPSEGSLRTTSVPVVYSRSPGGFSRPPPRLGEHTEEVLAEYADGPPGAPA
jgi:crotonobetainyl-CoA:carnitine CoA-transferase CaiB-like acyl-CoA transferase